MVDFSKADASGGNSALNKWAVKKIERERRIINAATELFDKIGYTRTTMDQIASRAGCGVATVYNYYASKEGIVTELLRKDIQAMLSAGKAVIDGLGPSAEPGPAVMALLSVYRDFGGSDWARRDLLRITIFPNLGNEGALAEFITVSEAQIQKQIYQLLFKLRGSGNLAGDLDLDDVTAIIFDIFNQSFGRYLTRDDLKFDDMFTQLSRRICLLFDNWRPSVRD
jgi:AcrR family transcriptional regulator